MARPSSSAFAPIEEKLRMHPATAEDRLAGSHAANDGIAFTGDAFGAAAYPAELLPIHLSGAVSQIATPPNPTE